MIDHPLRGGERVRSMSSPEFVGMVARPCDAPELAGWWHVMWARPERFTGVHPPSELELLDP